MKGYTFTAATFAVLYIVATTLHAVSAQETSVCFSEILAIAENVNVTSTFPAAQCFIALATEDACTVDVAPLSGPFMNACFAANAQFTTQDIAYNCLKVQDFNTYNVTYYFESFPDCVGMSCTDLELNDYYTNIVYPFLASEFDKQGFIGCKVTGTNLMTIDPTPLAPTATTPTTSAPIPTAVAPVPTTTAPVPTTTAPVATTVAPVGATTIPTSMAPVTNTAATGAPVLANAPITVAPFNFDAPISPATTPSKDNAPSPIAKVPTPVMAAPATNSTSNVSGYSMNIIYHLGNLAMIFGVFVATF